MVDVEGAAEAWAELEAAERREAELTRRTQDSEAERERAVEARADVVARLAAGEDVSAHVLAGTAVDVGAAEQRTGVLQDALREARVARDRAEKLIASVYRAECRRRAPIVRAAAAKAKAAADAARVHHAQLERLSSDLLLAGGNSATPQAVTERLLQGSAEFAPARAGV